MTSHGRARASEVLAPSLFALPAATALRPAADSAAVPVMGKGRRMRRGTKPAKATGPVARTSAKGEAAKDRQLEQRQAEEVLESRTQF